MCVLCVSVFDIWVGRVYLHHLGSGKLPVILVQVK